MRAQGQPARVMGLRDPQFFYLEFTSATGVLTAVKLPTGFTVSSLATGVANVTFPRSFAQFMLVNGAENFRGAPGTEHSFALKTVNLAAGTAVLVCSDNLAGTEEAPGDGTLRFLFLAAEGG